MFCKNDMMMLNDIIYKIYSIEDFDEMRKSFLTALKLMIPYEIATFSLSSTDKNNPYELTDPVFVGLPPERWELYTDYFNDMDYTRWTFTTSIANTYRESDLMTDEVRINTPYYQNVFIPMGIHHSAFITLIYNGKFYGFINLFRKSDDIDFTDREMFMLDMLKNHLSYRLSKEKVIVDSNIQTHPDLHILIDRFKLTNREIEILFLLLDGIYKNDICDQLSISPNTLKKHTSNIYRKTSVNSHRQLVKLMESL